MSDNPDRGAAGGSGHELSETVRIRSQDDVVDAIQLWEGRRPAIKHTSFPEVEYRSKDKRQQESELGWKATYGTSYEKLLDEKRESCRGACID